MRKDLLNAKELIMQMIEQELPKYEIAKRLNCKQATLDSYLKKLNIEYKGQQHKKGQQKGPNKYKPASYYLGENAQYLSSYKLKQKLIRDGLKRNCCEICGCSEWQGKELPLELHHKDGNHFNNTLDNLQILCPNCHSIQDGNSGKNVGKYSCPDDETVDMSGLEPDA